MKIYSEVIVAYDVAQNKARKKLFDGLLDIGLYPIQKSVFWGRVNSAERKAISRLFEKWLEGEDRALGLPARLSEAVARGDCFGYSKKEFEETSFEIL